MTEYGACDRCVKGLVESEIKKTKLLKQENA